MLFLAKLENEKRMRRLKKKANKNSNEFDEYSEEFEDATNNKIARRKNYNIMLHSRATGPTKHLKNRLLFGLTVTVGVAAVAMYAINSKDPQDILSKFYHLLSYKDF